MKKIAIFRSEIQEIGGIETWVYNLANLYGSQYDITLYYGTIHKSQLLRLAPFIKCKEYLTQSVKCDVALFCYDLMGYDEVEADRKAYIIHADHSAVWSNMLQPPEDCELFAVSKVAQEGAKNITGRDVGLLYNPVLPDTPRKLKLVSGTRLTTEKGLWRMETLAAELDRQGVAYEWDIYTSSYEIKPFSSSVVFKKPVQDFHPIIRDCDYVVQLSDTESFGYSIVEALVLNRGLIVTDLPVLRELDIHSDKAIIIPLHLKDYGGAVHRIKQEQYEPPKSDYTILFGEPSKVKRTPTVIENISKADIYLPEEDQWLEPGDMYIIEDKTVAEYYKKQPYIRSYDENI